MLRLEVLERQEGKMLDIFVGVLGQTGQSWADHGGDNAGVEHLADISENLGVGSR